MSLLLTLEQGPRTQAVQQASLDKGKLVIGRGATADWQIDDPDMYVSRTHCTITGDENGYLITDNSSSGLFIDGAHEPLGAGNSAELRNGMRLRLGDYVIWVDLQAQPKVPSCGQPASQVAASLGGDDFFAARTEEEPRPQRPAELPNPFDDFGPRPNAGDDAESRPRSQAFDDPFSLDPIATPEDAKPHVAPSPVSFDSPDMWADMPSRGVKPARNEQTGFDGPTARRDTALPPHRSEPPAQPHAEQRPAPVQPQPPQQPAGPSGDALREAFLRGMGLDAHKSPDGDPIAEMEKFGREYRLMMEGLMQLLRKRTEEKGNARVAQTIVGASEVNPLKFLPTVEDVMTMLLLAGRSRGFMEGEKAITDAVRDLAQHHVRAWRGVQGALRNMIDRFDPKVIEAELKESSTMEQLLAGGRSAKLWELYKKRHRDIAINAESRFLGDLGADFRKAYEGE